MVAAVTRSERKAAEREREHLSAISERLRLDEAGTLEHLEYVEGWRSMPVEDVAIEIEKRIGMYMVLQGWRK